MAEAEITQRILHAAVVLLDLPVEIHALHSGEDKARGGGEDDKTVIAAEKGKHVYPSFTSWESETGADFSPNISCAALSC